jgi:plasmid stabilization system protein ParE
MPNPSRLIWSPRSLQDLNEIWRYFAGVASPDIADNRADAIEVVRVLHERRNTAAIIETEIEK